MRLKLQCELLKTGKVLYNYELQNDNIISIPFRDADC